MSQLGESEVVKGGFEIPCASGKLSVDESGLIHLVEKNGD